MSCFIIASVSSDQDRFICYDKLGKMSVTNRREKAAKFSNAGKAWRVIVTQMPKKKRDGWKVIPYDEEEKTTDKTKEVEDIEDTPKRFKATLDTSTLLEEEFDWDRVRQNITGSFADVIAYKEHLTSKLNQIEAELCDCEHACEFFKCDVVHGYKLYAMIRERRIKRRYYKDELWKVSSVLGMSYSDIANGSIDNAFKKIEEQSYEPRVLTELFSDKLQSQKKPMDQVLKRR